MAKSTKPKTAEDLDHRTGPGPIDPVHSERSDSSDIDRGDGTTREHGDPTSDRRRGSATGDIEKETLDPDAPFNKSYGR